MTQLSRFWNGILAGDAINAPYDADDKFAEVLQSLANADSDTNGGRVCRGVLNELACTGVASPITIATGRAVVDGTWYENDAVTTLAVTMDKGYVILRKGTVAQTVRLAITEQNGGAYPALTQTRGTTWEYPLCSFVLAGGVVTITDMRTYTPYIPLIAPDFVRLAQVTLAAPDDLISFDITGLSYSLYVLIGTVRNAEANAGWGSSFVWFNASGPGEYAYNSIRTFGGGVIEDKDGATDGIPALGSTNDMASFCPESFSPGIMFLYNLHSTTQWKSTIGLFNGQFQTGVDATVLLGGLWRSTAEVTLINISDGYGDDMMVGTKVTLYGVR